MATTNGHINGHTNGSNGSHGEHASKPDYDAIVIGAGFGGLRIIHELRNLGLTFKVIEAGSGVGGTWYYHPTLATSFVCALLMFVPRYWNRYPGARTDSESWIYILNFSKELNAEWNWKECVVLSETS